MATVDGFRAQVGRLLNKRFELTRFLGLGASGSVYLAKDHDLGGFEVALKLLYAHHLANEKSVERFRAEVLIARRLNHPNIVKIHDFGKTEENQYFIVMEYVSGTSLIEIIESFPEKRIPLPQAIGIIYDLTSAIEHAHEHSVIHRDLKPQNILISADGSVKICDFGVARHLDSDGGLTRTGEAVGTPYYMAPELFQGKEADERSDVYSIGILAYELVSGGRPFSAETFYALARKHIEDPLPAFSRDLHIPELFEQTLISATAKDPATRYPSAHYLRTTLEPQLDKNWREQRDQLFERWSKAEAERLRVESKKRLRRLRTFLLLFVVIVVLVLTAIARSNRRQQQLLGSWALRVERTLGSGAAWPLKRLFGVEIHANEKTLRDLVWAALDEQSASDRFHLVDVENLIRMILESGIDPNTKSEHGTPLVALTLDRGLSGITWSFIQQPGIDPNSKNADGTPLIHLAIKQHLTHIASHLTTHPRFLLNQVDNQGNTALHQAVISRHPVLFTPLVDREGESEIDFNIRNKNGDTALGMALSNRDCPRDFAGQLIPRSDPNTPNSGGRTPLILAVMRADPEFIVRLLQRGADLGAKDDEGHSALYYAAVQENDHILQVIFHVGDLKIAKDVLEREELPEERKLLARKVFEVKSAARAGGDF